MPAINFKNNANNDTIYKWVLGVAIFALIYVMLPSNVRLPLVGMLVLAGILADYRSGGLQNDYKIGTGDGFYTVTNPLETK